jgi:tRNA-(ms[2]io[6]A)-hydroxylase
VGRLRELAAVEAQALTGELASPQDVRMHSVGLNPVAETAPQWDHL